MFSAKPHLRQHPQQQSSSQAVFGDGLPAKRSAGEDDYKPRQRRHRSMRLATIFGGIWVLVSVSSIGWWAALSSSFPSFSFTSLATDTFASSSPSLPPWVGPHALVAPSVSAKTNIHHHVRIIIRVHHEHRQLVRGLIYNFRFQQKLLAESLDEPTLSVDFALIPTELPGVNVTQAIAREFWSHPTDPFPHVYALDLHEEFYASAAERAAPLKCTDAQLKAVAHKQGKAAMKKICRYDNHVYYQATDVALKEGVDCAWCTHLLVTNDDNGYHPDYLKETLLELDPPLKEGEVRKLKRKKKRASSKIKLSSKSLQAKRDKRALAAAVEQSERKGWDLVATDFTTSGILLNAEWQLGSLDLGSIMLSKEIVAKVGGFIAALPPGAGAEEAHNADWLFTKKALEIGADATIVSKLLFFHN